MGTVISHCKTCAACKKKYGWEIVYPAIPFDGKDDTLQIKLYNGTDAVTVVTVPYREEYVAVACL